MKKILIKSLLVGAALLVGSSAWADEKTVTLFSQDFEDVTAATLSTVWTPSASYGSTLVTDDATYGNYVSCTGTKNINDQAPNSIWFYKGGSDIYTYDGADVKEYTVEFDALYYSNVRTNYCTLFMDGATVKSTDGDNGIGADEYVFSYQNTGWKKSSVKITTHSNAQFDLSADDWYHYKFDIDGSTSGSVKLTYTITNKTTNATVKNGTYSIDLTADGAICSTYKCQGVYFGKAIYDGKLYADNFKVTTKVTVEGDVAEKPTITPTGIIAAGRTYSISFLEGETLHYTLPGGTEQTVTEGTSVNVTATASGTLSAYTTKGSATSDAASTSVDMTPVQLNAPTYTLSFVETDGVYHPVYTFSSNQESVDFKPTATLSYTLNGGTSVKANSCTLSETGTLTITASAEGYTSASTVVTTLPNADYYQTYVFDAKTITKADDAGTDGGSTTINGTGCNFYTLSDCTYDVRSDITFSGLSFAWAISKNVPHGLAPRSGTGTIAFSLNAGELIEFVGQGAILSSDATSYSVPALTLVSAINMYTPVEDVKLPVSITSAGWATLYTPYALDFSAATPTGLEAYTATVSGSTVTLTKVDDVQAGTGVVLKGAAGTYSIPVAASSTTAKGDLKGSTTAATACTDAAGIYMLAKNGDNAQFKKATSGSIAAGKAYLQIGGGAANLRVVIEGEEATAIHALDAADTDEDVTYNVAGQRVNAGYKGIVIKNGKKYLRK